MSEPDPFKINEAVIDLWRCYTIERDMAKELEAENARLKAEVERLTKAEQMQTERVISLEDCIKVLKQDRDGLLYEESEQVTSLKAEVERLTKAGDERQNQMNLMFKEIQEGREAYQRLHNLYLTAKMGGQP